MEKNLFYCRRCGHIGSWISSDGGRTVYCVKCRSQMTLVYGIKYVNNTLVASGNVTGVLDISYGTREVYYNALSETSITSVNMPNSLVKLPGHCFEKCSNLKRVTFSNALEEIPYSCFEGCSALTEITIPATIKEIDFQAFKDCKNLRKIVFEGGPKVSHCAFEGCIGLKEIVIKGTVPEFSYISSPVFDKNILLDQIIIEKSAKKAEALIIQALPQAKKIKLLANVPEINGTAFSKIINFSHRESLEEIEIDNVKKIANYAFSGCTSLKRVIIKKVESIASCAFLNCVNLESITIPDGCIEISGFNKCKKLRDINMPSTVKVIGAEAFQECDSLVKIEIPNSVETISSSAFCDCVNLENIIIPESVTSIGSKAFDGCKKLSFLRLPAKLQKIGEGAFKSLVPKLVIIPKGIKEIGENAFGNDSNSQIKKECAYVVSKNTYVQNYLKAKGIKYYLTSRNDGLIANSCLIDGVLYYSKPQASGILIPNETKIIDSFAVCNNEIEKVVIPSGVKKVNAFAFSDCYRLREIVFNDKLQAIGSKAFDSFAGKMVDLPASVTEIAEDAFPKDCIVSIAGDMPFYSSRLARLKEQKRTIDTKKKRVSDLGIQLEEAKVKLDNHIASLPEKFEDISGLREEIRGIESSRDVERSFNNDERNYLNKRISDVQNEIKRLQEERKNCFFLAFSKKKEFDEDIARKQAELQSVRDDIDKLNNKSRADEKRFADLIAPVQRKLDSLIGEEKRWNDNKTYFTKSRDDIEKEIKSLSEEITKLSAKLREEEEALEKEHDKWVKTREKTILLIEKEKQEAEELKRKEKLELEKKQIISEIGVPTYSEMISLFDCNYSRESIVEEKTLSEALRNMIKGFNDEKRAVTHNRFVATNATKIERIKTINGLLGLEEENGISGLAPLPVPELSNSYIPERVTKLNDCFAKLDWWKRFKHSAVDIRTKKNTKANIHDRFFADIDYFSFKNDGRYLLVFPYFLIIYEPKKPLVALSYDKAKLAVKFTDSEEIRDDIPAFGELVYERHKHLNADGSVSRRYKDNPIIKTIRYTTVTIKSGYESFTFPTKTQDEAMQFENAFNTYSKVLTTGALGKVYSLVAESAEHQLIIEALDNLAKEEARLRELEKQREAEEKRMIEEERIAAKKAAEERKKAIIQRQRELNEERKREAEKIAEERKRVVKLFDDDFEDEAKVQLTEEDVAVSIPIEVVGNRLISNNVFKVALKFVDECKSESLIAYFVTNTGEIISNKKKIAVSSDEIVVGFILNSGIDYTAMQECLMRFETSGDILGDIDFKMNISFYSDF